MSFKFLFTGLLLAASGFTNIQAAETIVAPGPGTLKIAVDLALDGDVLLLQTGNYNLGSNITIATGITIRPLDSGQLPKIILNNFRMYPASPSTPITLQALTFIGPGRLQFSNTGEINILENDFTDVFLDLGSATGSCYIIGNHAQRSLTATLGYTVSLDRDCYVAGNTFDGTGSFTANSGYFIGNKVSSSVTTTTSITLYAAYAIGNEFIRDLGSNPPTSLFTEYAVAVFNAPSQPGLTGQWPFIANNIFKVIGTTGAPAGPIKSMSAVYLNTKSQLHNNVVDYAAFSWSTQGLKGMIHVQQNSTIQGNIVVDGNNNGMGALTFIDETERAESDTSYNICHNNAAHCGTSDGNLTTFPEFDNNTDYPLILVDSPAIDAGSTNDHWNDLDGTRNDMGIHGGPHPFSQYAAQIAPGETKPFIYPVFDEIQTLSGAQIDVSAIGVARFK